MKWFLIWIVFTAGEPSKYLVFFGENEAECKKAKALVYEKAEGADTWAECYPIRKGEKSS